MVPLSPTVPLNVIQSVALSISVDDLKVGKSSFHRERNLIRGLRPSLHRLRGTRPHGYGVTWIRGDQAVVPCNFVNDLKVSEPVPVS